MVRTYIQPARNTGKASQGKQPDSSLTDWPPLQPVPGLPAGVAVSQLGHDGPLNLVLADAAPTHTYFYGSGCVCLRDLETVYADCFSLQDSNLA